MSEHTQEPWEYGGQMGRKRGCVLAGKTPDGNPMYQVGVVAQDSRIAGGDPEANGRRIVAAVNALTGVSTAALEQGALQEVVGAAEFFLAPDHSETTFAEALQALRAAMVNLRRDRPAAGPGGE